MCVPEKCIPIKNNCKRSVLLKCYYFKWVKISTNDSLLFFFTACFLTDARFDPNTAGNSKQRNRTHYETVALVFGHRSVRSPKEVRKPSFSA